jgi:hypothetical protein
MWILEPKKLNKSGTYGLNFLFNQDKFYIMDNHLAATWCWLQKIDTSCNYQLIHIDRHYDLLHSQIDKWVDEIKNQDLDIQKIKIVDLLNIKYKVRESKEFQQIFRFDNYITIFLKLYPEIIKESKFATHDDGTKPSWFSFYNIDIYDLPKNINYWITEFDQKTILNIDIDYFFIDKDGNNNHFQFLTDGYILNICKEIKKSYNKIDVITIALSPEFCSGWKNSLSILKIITNFLN